MNTLSALLVPADDRRTSPRFKSNDDAVGLVRGREDGLACTVEDISDTGARISLERPDDFVPRKFKLHIPDRKLLVSCKQVWRKGRELGLRFEAVTDFAD
ncbi:MAG: PilZ domain-containing protein [Pseudomonadota bacterium]